MNSFLMQIQCDDLMAAADHVEYQAWLDSLDNDDRDDDRDDDFREYWHDDYEDDGQPSEEQEWYDFDPDC